MRKETDKKHRRITYFGTPSELKEQLNYILERWPEVFKRQTSGDIKNLEEITDPFNNLRDMYQIIYFNNTRIIYIVNPSSSSEDKEFNFNLIAEICRNADYKHSKKLLKN